MIPSPRTDLASSPTASLTASQLRSPSDHSHEPLPVSPGVISPPPTSLASTTTASQPRSMGDHSREPPPASPRVIPLPRADLASGSAVPSTTSRLQSASTSTPLSPLGPALTSFLSASPSFSASAPGVAGLSVSQSTLQRRLSSPALPSSPSSGTRS